MIVKYLRKGLLMVMDIQVGREISAIIVTEDYLLNKEPKNPYNFFSYFNI